MNGRTPVLLVFLLVPALLATPARAEGPSLALPAPLTLERITDGKWPNIGPGAPSITWIPGVDAWLEWRQDDDDATHPGPDSEVLLRVDAITGDATPVVSAQALERAVESAAPQYDVKLSAFRAIGRRGPPRLTLAPDGSAVIVRQRTALLHVDLNVERPPFVLPVAADLQNSGRRIIADVRVAPGGRRISFVRHHDLHAIVIEGDDVLRAHEIRLTDGGTERVRNGDLDWVYPEELDAKTAAWWSPDGARLVYLRLDETNVPTFPIVDPTVLHGETIQQSYPYVGDPNPVPSMHVVSLDGSPEVTLDLSMPGSDEIYAPWAFWTPDGSRVVVAVMNRRQSHYELRSCDPKTGRGTPIWRERSDTWVEVANPPMLVTSRNAMIVRSRRDGYWRHWLAPLDASSAPRALTADGFETGEALAVDEVAGVLFHAARSRDGLLDGVYRVPLDGGPDEMLIDDGSSHSASWSTTGHVFLDAASTITSPPKVVVRTADGKRVRELTDASTPEYRALDLARPEFLSLAGGDGTPLSAVLWKPRDLDPSTSYPLLVYGYGGPGSRLVGDSWQGGNGLVRALVDAGFLVLTVDGRGTGGRGRAFETSVNRHLGEFEADDQASAVRALARERPYVDGKRVGIWGGSYGGFLALTAVVRHPNVFRAAVALAPVTDWRLYDSIYTERFMGLPSDPDNRYDATSIVHRAKDLRGDVLILHGLSDDNVHAQNSLRLVDACLAAGSPVDWTIYPRRGHAIDGGGARLDVYRRILNHFRRSLGASTQDRR